MYSMTQILNFKTVFCSTVASNDCFSINWYTKIVVSPGGTLDFKNSAAGLSWLSLNF